MTTPLVNGTESPSTMVPTATSPKLIASISSGRMRRHSRVGASATPMMAATSGFGRSVRSAASSVAPTTASATSSQSRHTRRGGGGAAAGAFHAVRRRLIIRS